MSADPVRRRVLVVLAAGAIGLLGSGPRAEAHPMEAHPMEAHPIHTTMTELTYDVSQRVVTAHLRVFADDFGATVARRTGGRPASDGVPPAAAALAYVSSAFALTDPRGRAVRLEWCGARRAGEVIFVCVRGTATTPLRGARLRNALMFDTFADQVNIVRAPRGSRTEMLLFTPGNDTKALP